MGAAAPRRRARDALAHHPDHPDFAADTFRVFGARICVGCATVYPAFLLALGWFALQPLAPWWGGVAVGLPLAAVQVVSMWGWTRRRAAKVAVKAALGLGLALATAGVLASPLERPYQVLALAALLALSLLSAVPRARRLAAWEAAHGHGATGPSPAVPARAGPPA